MTLEERWQWESMGTFGWYVCGLYGNLHVARAKHQMMPAGYCATRTSLVESTSTSTSAISDYCFRTWMFISRAT
eukprot:scaffold524307_cov20-Prasinocladus_malaysianus.AAC.1